MSLHLEIETFTCAKTGEELCGDTVRVVRSPERVLVILSDGLGSGVQANVSATLTSEILSRMLTAGMPLKDVVPTVASTLPVRQSVNVAYATFLIIDVDRTKDSATISNFGNPPVLHFHRGSCIDRPVNVQTLEGREIRRQEFRLLADDIIVAMSDGVPGAGTNVFISDGWGINSITKHLERTMLTGATDAKSLVRELASQTLKSYGMAPGDDASIVVLRARHGRAATVFTGPPADTMRDDYFAERFMKKDGKKIICGDTTGTIVSLYLGTMTRQIPGTALDGLPPLSRLDGVDLVTEGILTLSRAAEYLAQSKGERSKLPVSRNGAAQLAEELLLADEVTFMVGLADNAAYTKLKLPSSSLFRKSVVRQLVDLLTGFGKQVEVEWC